MFIVMKKLNFLACPGHLKRVILALFLVTAVTLITMGAVYDAALKNVTMVIVDEFNGTETNETIKTRKSTVEEFLTENEISVGESERINKNMEDEISDNDVLIIRKGRAIELSADGETQKIYVTKPTVSEALEEIGVKLSQEDVVTPELQTQITENMSVVIDRYTTEEVIETEPVGFKTVRKNDSAMEAGTTVVVTEGVEGEKSIKYSVKKKNGEIISKEYVSEEISKQPVNKVIKVGSKRKSDNEFTFSKKIEVSATAYGASSNENGGYSKTAYGLTPKYGVVAVDPKVIPLGTKLYIESSDGGKSWSYGYCIAGDTGGAIKGNKVDLCFNTESECIRFGRRSATVYILN